LLQTLTRMRFAFSRYGTLLMLLFSLGLVSCAKKTMPTAVAPAPTPVATTIPVDVEEIDFGYMHGKGRLVYKDDKKDQEVKAHIRIRKDSVIWMNFTVVGVQGGKALINKDSITVVSSVRKEYFVFDYKELSKRFNFDVDYALIEAAMLGNLMRARTPSDAVAATEQTNVVTQTIGAVTIKNAISKTSKKIEKVELNESASGNALQIDYSNFQPLGEKQFAYNNLIRVLYKTVTGSTINTSILVEFNKAEVGDKELKFPFKIPPKYDRR
jgi:hypothetical protein